MRTEKRIEKLGEKIAASKAVQEAAMAEIIGYVVAGEISAYQAWKLSGIPQGTFYRAVNKAIKGVKK